MPGSEDDVTQNFLFVDSPTFNAPNAKKFLGNLKQLAMTTDKGEGAKRALSSVLQVTEKVVEAFGGKSATLVSMGGHAETQVLGQQFFTAAALRYGEFIAKMSLKPLSPDLCALTDQRVDLSDVEPIADNSDIDLIALDDALAGLERKDPRKADLVKLRFFAGLTVEQAARALGIATSTADEDWAYARSWLRLEIAGRPSSAATGTSGSKNPESAG